jgi:excisionase family DNA binding protein
MRGTNVVPEHQRSTHSDAITDQTRDPAGLLGISDVAARLGTPERFVRRLVAERRVPFHKIGKYVRFDPRDIDRYLAEQRVEALL